MPRRAAEPRFYTAAETLAWTTRPHCTPMKDEDALLGAPVTTLEKAVEIYEDEQRALRAGAAAAAVCEGVDPRFIQRDMRHFAVFGVSQSQDRNAAVRKQFVQALKSKAFKEAADAVREKSARKRRTELKEHQKKVREAKIAEARASGPVGSTKWKNAQTNAHFAQLHDAEVAYEATAKASAETLRAKIADGHAQRYAYGSDAKMDSDWSPLARACKVEFPLDAEITAAVAKDGDLLQYLDCDYVQQKQAIAVISAGISPDATAREAQREQRQIDALNAKIHRNGFKIERPAGRKAHFQAQLVVLASRTSGRYAASVMDTLKNLIAANNVPTLVRRTNLMMKADRDLQFPKRRIFRMDTATPSNVHQIILEAANEYARIFRTEASGLDAPSGKEQEQYRFSVPRLAEALAALCGCDAREE